MTDFQVFVQNSMLFSEGLAAFVALLYYRRLKELQWKLLVVYLVIIFLGEAYSKWGYFSHVTKAQYYNYLLIPIQFIFLYWLYAAKSLGRPKLFWILSILYLLSFIPNELYFAKNKIVFAFNYTFGCFMLMILVIMEYYKQITSQEILNFYKNKMFYINLGITLAYIGTLPFMAFMSLLVKYKEIWDIYFSYFLISGFVLYILFASSFIWGKRSS
ncbi:hypothetical protein V2E39_22095 [Chryseobacterium arthrosphaerae]|uniref:Histidine kinase N-terminal 7TM region domain-containing protein n=1 Tax=Chryseobacterium arthrosphaerae TaxID=651561 RepID=A0A1B8Z9V1_9FLAO|nr:hypothetical protein [Chryseobacterium arthrosphaerae]AYZ10512.1 hypothetical protein EGY05_00440 [Chryseobacterium arthrosphaerae]MDG4653693.1 hypothetical protein [Chryseobacterium arthrosphaerae]OCA68355.1 hypothetical protein BBI00_22470 [Chryseobacterium arthrosphaerae]QUY55870.1 hypothetical protein I2F65_00425 [Chryseobacterium arthrosphaerae]UEQ75724.1 hypothetical protein J8N07_19055 [Chryseobacterium arthrosphaerae]